MTRMMKKLFPGMKIKLQTLILLVSLLFSVLMMALLTALFSGDMISFAQEHSTENYERQTAMLASRVQYSLDRMRNYVELIRADEALWEITWKFGHAESTYERFMCQYELDKKLVTYDMALTDQLALHILTPQGTISRGSSIYSMETIDSIQRLLPEEWMPQRDGIALIRTSGQTNYRFFDQLQEGTLLYAAPLWQGDENFAVFVVSMSPATFQKILNSQELFAISREKEKYLGDEKCVVIPGKEERNGDVFIRDAGGGQARIFACFLPEHGLTLSLMENLDTMYSGVRTMRLSLIAAILLCFAATLFFGKRLFRHMMAPMELLSAKVCRYSDPSRSVPQERRTGKMPLQKRLIAFLFLTVLLPILFYLATYSFTATSCIQNLMREVSTNLIQTSADGVDRVFQEQQDLLRMIGYGEAQREDGESIIGEQYRLICQLWNTRLNLLAWENGEMSFYSDELLRAFCPPPAPLPASGVSIGSALLQLPTQNYLPLYFIASGSIGKFSEARQPLCLMSLIEESYIQSAFSRVQDAQIDVFICNADGTVLSSTRADKIGQPLSLPAGVVPVARASYSAPLTYYFSYDESLWTVAIQRIVFSRVPLILILFLLTILAFGPICRMMVSPLEHIRGLLDQNLMLDIDELYRHNSIVTEVDALGNSFNEMKTRIDELMDDLMRAHMESYEVKIERREAELHSLQSQIHPHFVCNLLETIRVLNASGKHAEANRMILNMGDLFRYSLPRENPVVELEEELAYMKAYANILQEKYPHIHFRWQVNPELYSHHVLRLLLQPLVENAVLHGLNVRPEGGTVCLSARAKDGGLELTVQDDGVGMDLNQVRFGVGLENVKKRIQLFYQDSGSFSVESQPGQGTTVRIYLPENTENSF